MRVFLMHLDETKCCSESRGANWVSLFLSGRIEKFLLLARPIKLIQFRLQSMVRGKWFKRIFVMLLDVAATDLTEAIRTHNVCVADTSHPNPIQSHQCQLTVIIDKITGITQYEVSSLGLQLRHEKTCIMIFILGMQQRVCHQRRQQIIQWRLLNHRLCQAI